MTHGGQKVGLLAVEPFDPRDILALVHLVFGLHDGPRQEPRNSLDDVDLGRAPRARFLDLQDVDHPDHPLLKPERDHDDCAGAGLAVEGMGYLP